MKKREIKQGDIYYCNLSGDTIGSEQKLGRPVIVLSLNILNNSAY